MRIDHRIHRIATVVAFTLAGCGSISVAPPPGLDSGDGTGDPGKADTSRQDLPDGTRPDPGPDVPPLCKTHEDCKDVTGLGPCIVGRCDLATQTCVLEALTHGEECDDGDPCTVKERCDNGHCIGHPLSCDDENPCTVDTCLGGGCAHELLSGPACDDGLPCTVKDVCQNGTCIGIPVTCDDQDPCTRDVCVPSSEPCPTGFSSPPNDGYRCCHETCPDLNPTCTPEGCACGQMRCDPVSADRCVQGDVVDQLVCKCGESPPCAPNSCCRMGQCEPGPCPVPR